MALAGSSARELAGASFQKASAQILVMENSVKQADARAVATRIYCSASQTWPARSSALQRNRRAAALPPMKAPGLRNRIGQRGVGRVKSAEIFKLIGARARRYTTPLTRKRFVLTMMW